MVRSTTPWAPLGELYCDDFHRDANYSTWRPQGTGDWLLIYTESGSGRFVSPKGTVTTRAGDIVLYEPHEFQDYSTCPDVGEWRLLWAHFLPKPHWQAWLRWPATNLGLKRVKLAENDVHAEFRASMRRMLDVSRRPVSIAGDLAMLALEEALLWARLAAYQDKWVTMDNRVRRAIDYLAAHFRDPFQMDKLAHHCGLSVSRLAHLFTAQTGLSPQRFLERHRMQIASRLLRMTDFTVTEIASEAGYDDPFYFSNRFRRYSGHSPSQFRVNKQHEVSVT
jgi:AraC family transcriptional regulator of arabinose operon